MVHKCAATCRKGLTLADGAARLGCSLMLLVPSVILLLMGLAFCGSMVGR